MKPSTEFHILWLGPTVLIAVLLAATGCGLGGTTTTAEGFDAATTAETQALRAAESKAQPGRIVPTESVLPARAVFEPVVTQSEPQIDQQDGYQQAAAAIEDSHSALRRELAMRAFREAGRPEMSAPGERRAVVEEDGTVMLYMRGNKRKSVALQKHLAEQRAVHEELRRQEAEKQAAWRREALLREQERQAQFWAAEQERDAQLWAKESWRQLERGMSKMQVQTLLGKPGTVSVCPYGEIWYYPDALGGSISFGRNERVSGWTEP